MLRASEIWEIIQSKIPRNRWVSLKEIYQIVEKDTIFDSDDFEPEVRFSSIPKWKRNVRNVLQHKKKTGNIQWNGKAGYYL